MSKVSLNDITYKARADFINLLEKSWKYGKEHGARYSSQDVRCDFFVVFSELNLWLVIQFDIFVELLDRDTTRISRYMTLTPDSRVQFLSQFDTINRASYCAKAMFDVEHLLRTMTQKLTIHKTKRYWDLTNQLLACLKIHDDKTRLILNTPAHVRNSLHNDGRTSYEFDIILERKKHHIKANTVMRYTGWNYLYLMFDSLLDKLVEIIDNPMVKSIGLMPHTSMTSKDVI